MRHAVTTVLGTTALCLLAGACGTTDEGGRASAPAAATSPGCADVEPATGPVRLTDAFGRRVELDAPPERVAVLEWQQLEDVLTLCAVPVAAADTEGYSRWSTAEELPEGVEDVGGRGEPNLDALYATDPDLVIVEAESASDQAVTTLADRGVPVLATKGADAERPVSHMLDTFELIGAALGRQARAEAVVEEFEDHLARAEEAVADVESRRFAYLDGWIQGGNVSLRPYGQGSLVGELGEALGMENAWTGAVDEPYGLGETDIEGITAIGDATIFYTGTDEADSDVVAALEGNPIWASLPAVAEGRAHAFPPGIWTFGGPRSSMQVVDAYVDLLAG